MTTAINVYTITYHTDQNWIGQITKVTEDEAERTATGMLGVLMARGTITYVRITNNDTIINEFEY